MKKITSVVCLALLTFCFQSCFFKGKEVVGDGNIVTEDYEVTGRFSQIDISSVFDIELIQSEENRLTIIADKNIFDHIDVRFKDGTLEIEEEEGISLSPSKQMKLIIAAPDFSSIALSGVCNVTSKHQIRCAKDISFNLSGSASIDLDLIADEIEISSSGIGTIDLKGKAKDLDIKASGASNIHCFALTAQNVSVDISGAGTANVYVNGELEVEISGAGSVNYKGTPTLITKKLSGVGNLNKVE